jgi:aspartate 1-decarboxylase
MKIKLLKSKIHRATVTGACLDYEGSISIDRHLMNLANIVPYEKVHVLNVTNGNRLETYAIPSLVKGEICINGAAAHLINKNDIVIIVSYVTMKPKEAETFLPTKIYPNEKNEIKK